MRRKWSPRSTSVGRHLEAAGLPDQAIPHYARAAEEELAAHAYGSAIAHWRRLLALSSGADTGRIRAAMAQTIAIIGSEAEAEAEYRRALHEAEARGQAQLQAEILLGLGLLLRRSPDPSLSRRYLNEAAQRSTSLRTSPVANERSRPCPNFSSS